MMSHREIAAALNWSVSKVKLIEQRALEKVALALGLPMPHRPQWMRQYLGKHFRCTIKHEYRCSKCHQEGHSRRRCAA